jgi:hypothetical protein
MRWKEKTQVALLATPIVFLAFLVILVLIAKATQ